MKIIVGKETAQHEKRVAMTPEIVKKLVELGHQIVIEKDAGKEAGLADALYEKAGATVVKEGAELYKGADVIVRVVAPTVAEISRLPQNSYLIGMLKPFASPKEIKAFAKQKVTSFALELVPRISRAQTMDVLSSQSNLAGYKAVIDAAAEFGRSFPMMMTAAGTIPPARVLVLGAGVAGLQAIATAHRLGARVSAFDVREAVKEQVESLGASFVKVEADESGEGTGGYAKEMSEDYKKRQMETLAKVIKDQDIVITTAQIPGKPAPILITDAMVKSMKPGAVIVDLSVESGGNCSLSESGKIVTKNSVKIIGHANVPSRIAHDSSQVYARNVFHFLKALLNESGNGIDLNMEDEIIKATTLTHDGQIIHPDFK